MNTLERLVDWQIERSGEVILWGQGTIFLDLETWPNDGGYRLQILEEDLEPADVPARFWALTDPDGYPDPARIDLHGFAIGTLERRMVPEATPDLTGVELRPSEGFRGRLCPRTA